MSRPALDDVMLERLRRSPSPILRRQLAAAGLDGASLRPDDLERILTLGPADLALERLDDPVGNVRLADAPSPVRLGTCLRDRATIVITWTAGDLARSAEAGARALARAGVMPGMKVANTLEGGFATPGSLALGDAVERLGALDVPLGPVRDDKTAVAMRDFLDRIEADVLVIEGDGAKALLPEILRRPPRAWKGTVWLGADLPGDLPGWARRWISVPEVSVFLASECERGTLHLDPEVAAEISEGGLVLFAAHGDSPVMRYAPGLRAVSLGDPCACGDAAVTLRLV